MHGQHTDRPDADYLTWARAVLGIQRTPPTIPDPVIAALALRYPGMRPFSNGALFEGIVTAIIGQSISVQAAALLLKSALSLIGDVCACRRGASAGRRHAQTGRGPAAVLQPSVRRNALSTFVSKTRSKESGVLS